LPDIVLGALIGVISAVVGYIMSYRNIKLQLSYQERETQRNRLIEVRKELLLDLRRTISEWVEYSNQQVNMDVRLKKAIEKYDNTSLEWQSEIKEYTKVSEQMKQLTQRLGILRAQVSDKTLDNLIGNVRETQYNVDVVRSPIVEFFNNPSGANANTIESVMQQEESLLKKVREQVLHLNKRIEELLSGEPSD